MQYKASLVRISNSECFSIKICICIFKPLLRHNEYRHCSHINAKRSNDKGNKREIHLARTNYLIRVRGNSRIERAVSQKIVIGIASWNTPDVIMTRQLPFFEPLFRSTSFHLFSRSLRFVCIEKLAPSKPYGQLEERSSHSPIFIAARRLQVCSSLIELESFRLVVSVHPVRYFHLLSFVFTHNRPHLGADNHEVVAAASR